MASVICPNCLAEDSISEIREMQALVYTAEIVEGVLQAQEDSERVETGIKEPREVICGLCGLGFALPDDLEVEWVA